MTKSTHTMFTVDYYLRKVPCCILFFILAFVSSDAQQVLINQQGWNILPEILKRISPPIFPQKVFDVTKYGAVGDGETDCSEAFKNAIQDCHTAGGGKVVVPTGVFLTGAIHLKSNVNVYISKDAIIRFSTDPKKYLPVVFTRWEGVECINYSPFLYAYNQQNIAITGEGTLDGSSDSVHWWSWKGKKEYGWHAGAPNQNKARALLMNYGKKGIPVSERVFGEGFYLRPNFIQLYRCKNVQVEGVHIVRSPMWEIHPVLCENVIVENVIIVSHGPNNDGFDPESCKDVLIKNCSFDTGDDCIAIKSGRDNDGRRVNIPSENIIIQHCQFKDGHGGIAIGSEESGSVRNVFVEDCELDSPNLDTALRVKANADRGGTVENLFVRRLHVGQVKKSAIGIDLLYEGVDKGDFNPKVQNIEIDQLVVDRCPRALILVGYEKSVIRNVRLTNSEFKTTVSDNEIHFVEDLKFVNCRASGKELIR